MHVWGILDNPGYNQTGKCHSMKPDYTWKFLKVIPWYSIN